jgi:transposase
MSKITIQCRLVASEATRQALWDLMARLNTPLINELIEQTSQHPDFETWKQRGKIPATAVSQLCKPLKNDPRFAGQPSRFYISAAHVVDYIYKSWLAIQKRLQHQLDGKTRWINILKSDAELSEICQQSIEVVRARASEILAQLKQENAPVDASAGKNKKRKKAKQRSEDSSRSLAAILFEAYQNTENILDHCAINYLLKNGSKVSDREEDPKKFAKRYRKTQVQIQRLQDKLEGRMPGGRDLTGQKWLETLAIATTTVPQSENEAKGWQAQLLAKPSALPFPLIFETNEDMSWSCNQKGRLCVKFNGLGEHTFEVYCDQRQLHWFQRFLEDQETKRNSKNQHSSALFTLRSGRLAWQQGQGKGEAWSVHKLVLYCTVETRLWSAEGTEQVRQEKSAEVTKIVARLSEKKDLSKTQEEYARRLHSTLTRINNSFNRPSQPLPLSNPSMVVGVSLGWDKPATVAVWNANTHHVVAYRSIRQLLGNDYNLLNRQRQKQQQISHQRHKAQRKGASNQVGTSDLGQYVDRLIAKAIVAIAQHYQASSIAVPKVSELRESLQTEIQAKAEQNCPGYLQGQQRYMKQYSTSIHRWSYSRLIQNIQTQAAKFGILLGEGQQPVRGSPQDKAKAVAIAAYQARE